MERKVHSRLLFELPLDSSSWETTVVNKTSMSKYFAALCAEICPGLNAATKMIKFTNSCSGLCKIRKPTLVTDEITSKTKKCKNCNKKFDNGASLKRKIVKLVNL